VEGGGEPGVVAPVAVEPVPEEPQAAASRAIQHKNNEIRNVRERIRYMIFSLHITRSFLKHIFYFLFSLPFIYCQKLDF
jgi:hypothetical protein